MVVIQAKRGTSSNLSSSDIVLESGQLSIENDTRRMKVGDGTSTYESLPYINPDVEIYTDNGIRPKNAVFMIQTNPLSESSQSGIVLQDTSISALIHYSGETNSRTSLIIRATSVEFDNGGATVPITNVSTPSNTTDAANKQYVDTQIQNILLKMYPVGSIYMSVVNTNPSEYFGGTWVAWGQGKVPVGVDTNDTDFNTVEKSAGSKTSTSQHSHLVNNHTHRLGSHTHTISAHTHNVNNHTLTVDEMPSHSHSLIMSTSATAFGVQGRPGHVNDIDDTINAAAITSTGGGQPHNHGSTTGTALTTNQSTVVNTSGASPATNQITVTNNTVQPYITCYMWKRTA